MRIIAAVIMKNYSVIASGSEAIQMMVIAEALCFHRASSFNSNWVASLPLAMTASIALAITENYTIRACSTAAAIKLANNGWGSKGRDFNSG